MVCGPKKTKLRSNKKFTKCALTSFSHFDENEVLYSANSGDIFLCNFHTHYVRLVCNVAKTSEKMLKNYKRTIDYPLVMQTYNRDCFVGTSWGFIYLVPNVTFWSHTELEFIGMMSSGVHNLEIFGLGLNLLLYTANQTGRLCAYKLRELRSTFEQSRRPSIMQNEDVQMARATLAPMALASTLSTAESAVCDVDGADDEESDVHEFMKNEIEPCLNIKFAHETCEYLCQAKKAIAYLTERAPSGGWVRFYNQFNEELIFEYKFTDCYPITCFIHSVTTEGSVETFAHLGTSNGDIYEINLHSKTIEKAVLYKGLVRPHHKSLVPEIQPGKPGDLQEAAAEVHEVKTCNGTEMLSTENGSVNDILGIINDNEEEVKSVSSDDELSIVRDAKEFTVGKEIESVFISGKFLLIATSDEVLTLVKKVVSGRANGFILFTRAELRPDVVPNKIKIERFNGIITIDGVYEDGVVLRGMFNQHSGKWAINHLE